SIAENNKALALVGTIKPTASYSGQKFSFAINGADAGNFAIDAAKGSITVKSGVTLNYENKTTYSFNVVVSDLADSTRTTTGTVAAQVLTSTAARPASLTAGSTATLTTPLAGGKATLTIDENVPGGTTVNGLVVATLTAADQDQLASTLHYQKDATGKDV